MCDSSAMTNYSPPYIKDVEAEKSSEFHGSTRKCLYQLHMINDAITKANKKPRAVASADRQYEVLFLC